MLVALLQASAPPANLGYLFAAFAALWVVFFGYAFFLTRRQQELRREIQAARRLLEQHESPESGF